MEHDPPTVESDTQFEVSSPDPFEEEPTLPVGSTLGRYELEGVLGRGGMGIVYSAHDPVLERKVALKVVRRHGSEAKFVEARDRMLREAQALAHLSHPNVVTLFDVTVVDGQLVLAMELVEGSTLKDWLEQGTRSWPEVLAMFTEAGAGLAAAHDASIVHRDFKPANVLIDALGRPRVADFGVARVGSAPSSIRSKSIEIEASSSLMSESMTATGTVLGTPLYMAPEQRMGEEIDQRCDVFAFCVALYIALYGQRPFPGETDRELLRAQVHGKVIEPPRSSGVPSAVFAALRRGLASEPRDRYATMEDLLRALSRGAGQTRRRRTAALVLVGALGLGGAAFALQPAQEPTCPRDPAGLGSAWGDQRRAAVASAFEGSDEPYADAAWSRIEPRLGDYAEAWLDTRQEACRTSLGLTARPSEEGDRMNVCLERRRKELGALTEVLTDPRPEVVQHAVAAVADLAPAEDCTTAAVGDTLLPDDAEQRAQVLAFQSRLAGVEARLAAGSYADGLADAEALLEQAEALGHEPTRAEVLYVLGTLQGRAGELEPGVATLETAAHLATAEGHDRLAARASIELSYLLGQQLKRYEPALEWARHAEAATHRVGDPPEMLGRLLGARGNVLEGQGHFVEAEADYQRALSLLRESSPDSTLVARALNNLGNVRFRQGQVEEAGRAFEQAHEAWARALGPDHPDAVMPLNNLASVKISLGDEEAGQRMLERVLNTWQRALGPDHFRLALPLNNLAVLANRAGDHEASLAYDLRALEVRRKAYGPDHPEVGQSLFGVGTAMLNSGRCAEAIEYFRETLEIYERQLGPEHHDVARVLANYALCQVEQDEEPELALPLAERSVAIRKATFGAEAHEVRRSLYPLGVVQMGLNRPEEAIATLEHALAIGPGEGMLDEEADIRFDLAKAYAQAGREESVVVATARRAREDFLVVDEQEEADGVDAWLAERARSRGAK